VAKVLPEEVTKKFGRKWEILTETWK